MGKKNKALQKSGSAKTFGTTPLSENPAPEENKKSELEKREADKELGISQIEQREAEKDSASEESLSTQQKANIIKLPERVAHDKRIIHGVKEGKLVDYYKVLRTQIIQKMSRKNRKNILITSSVAGEGKTLTALNLAIAFSKAIDFSVLLVEADLKRPALQKYLRYSQSMRGLADYFLDDVPASELLVNPGIPKLDIIFAGRRIPDSSELLGSTKMKQLVEDLARLYENSYVLFDMSSVHEFPDALVLTEFIDTVLFVVAAESTPLEKIISAQKKIKDRDLLGLVLNKAFL